MWIPLLAVYLLTGLVVITCTSAKQEMLKLAEGVMRPRHMFEPMPK